MEYLFYCMLPAPNKILTKVTRQNKFSWQQNFLFFQKKFNYNIFNDNTQEQLI